MIIGVNDHAEWLQPCLSAVMAQTLPPWRVTVLAGSATAPQVRMILTQFPQVRLIDQFDQLGPAAACNRAAKQLRDAQILVLIDPDAILALDALEHLTSVLQSGSSIGVLGCKVLDGDVETIHHVGLELRGNGLPRMIAQGQIDRGRLSGVREVPVIQQGALAIRNEVWVELGGFDEGQLPSHYEQVDLCLRARSAHWRVAVDCDATVTHFGLPEAGIDRSIGRVFFRARARFLRKYYRPGQWLTRYLPDEVRWLCSRQSAGLRWIALSTLAQEYLGTKQSSCKKRS